MSYAPLPGLLCASVSLPDIGLVMFLMLIAGASIAGGTSAALLTIGHRRMQVLLSLTGGVMLGVGILHLLPHAFFQLAHDIDRTAFWVLAGFFLMFLLERAFHGHAHHAADGSHEAHPHHISEHGRHEGDPGQIHRQGGHSHGPHAAAGSRWAWLGAFAGLALHSLADGAALAASVQADGEHGAGLLSGFATFVAVVLHKPFDSLMIATLTIAAGMQAFRRRLVTLTYATMVPLGAVAFRASLGLAPEHADDILGIAMAMAAGAFLCIAAADLLPEVEFHSHDRLLLTAALTVGIGLAWGMTVLEHASGMHAVHTGAHDVHSHDHGPEQSGPLHGRETAR
jgi:zinc and cadmium transporter